MEPTRSTIVIRTTFARNEKKYLLTDGDYRTLMEEIRTKLAYDDFAHSQICSLYYDTANDELINRSLEKPLYKEKLRIRSYGRPDADTRVYVELKKKFKGVVYKRRVACSYAAARAFMNGEPYARAVTEHPLVNPVYQAQCLCANSMQIAAEIANCLHRNPGLQPRMVIITNRVALHTTDGSDVRITLDIDPVWRNTSTDLDNEMEGVPLFDDGRIIMEIKCAKAYPLWLSRALAAAKVYPQSCSKYGRAYVAQHDGRTARPTMSVVPLDSVAQIAAHSTAEYTIPDPLSTPEPAAVSRAGRILRIPNPLVPAAQRNVAVQEGATCA